MSKPFVRLLAVSAAFAAFAASALLPALADAAEPLFAPAPLVPAELPVLPMPPVYYRPVAPVAPTPSAAPACVPTAPVRVVTAPCPVCPVPAAPAPCPTAPPSASASTPTAQPTVASPTATATAASPPPPIDTAKVPVVNVPRVFSLGVGWIYSPVNSLPITNAPGLKVHSQGIIVEPQLLWQVRGFARGWPAWVGFGTSFHYLFGGSVAGAKDSFGLAYGISVKHALWPRGRFRLYLNYGLGAAQMWVRENDGRGVGHLTKLGIGADIRLHRIVQTSLEVSYRYINIPLFSSPSNTVTGFDLHALGLTAALWIGR